MVAMNAFNAGLDALADWGSADYEWLALTAGTFDAEAPTVALLLDAATEVTVTGYARQAATGKVRTVDDAAGQITYLADDPSWAGLDPGETIAAIVLYRAVTDDADSVPIGWWAISPAVATDAADPLVFTLADGIVAYLDQAA